MSKSEAASIVNRQMLEISAALLFCFSLVRQAASGEVQHRDAISVLCGWLLRNLALFDRLSRSILLTKNSAEEADLEQTIEQLRAALASCVSPPSNNGIGAPLPGLQRAIIDFQIASQSFAPQALLADRRDKESPEIDEIIQAIGGETIDTLPPASRLQMERFLYAGARRSLNKAAKLNRGDGTFVPGAWPIEEEALVAPDATSYVEAPIPASPNLLISLPRSGLNWVRYCIERMTGMRTPGSSRLIDEGDEVAFHRSHRALSRRPYGDRLAAPLFDELGDPRYRRIAIIVRNPCESFVRHAETDVRLLLDLIENIAAFDAFSGPKMLLYYEDILNDIGPIRELAEFFELPITTEPPRGLPEIRLWSNESRDLYRDRFGRSMSNRSFVPEKGFDPLYHSRNLSDDTKGKVLDFLKRLNPGLQARYLARYYK